ncbi:hypothetical protein F5Y13DRAFT_183810 [Hypoxylon sp. FL1857]|nr:hypothetical protein F5Y13DRAFT_183810 [Hypoxylon sp. FL1857]
MAALAAIVNKAVDNDKSINLYFNTSKAQLGISLQSGTDKDDQATDTWETSDDDYNGYILNPSSMAAAYYRGVNFVVAATMPKLGPNQTQTEVQISLVSPVYQKLKTTTLGNSHITLCTTPDGNEGWLYYLDSQATSTKILKELSLSTGASQVFNTVTDVAANASLAAWYDSHEDQRHVVYEGSGLIDFNVETGERVIIISGNNAQNTSLAAAYDSSEKKAYLYFYDASLVIQRVIKNKDGWGVSQPVPGAPKIAEGSQITVAQAHDFNHVFYVAKDFGTQDVQAWSSFTHIRDKID